MGGHVIALLDGHVMAHRGLGVHRGLVDLVGRGWRWVRVGVGLWISLGFPLPVVMGRRVGSHFEGAGGRGRKPKS